MTGSTSMSAWQRMMSFCLKMNTLCHIDGSCSWTAFIMQDLWMELKVREFTWQLALSWGARWDLNPFSPVFKTGADPTSASPHRIVPSIVESAGRHEYNTNSIKHNHTNGVTRWVLQQQLAGGSSRERSRCLRM